MRSSRLLVLLAVVGLVLTSCGDASPTPSDLPRTTDAGIAITETATEELLPIAGCHTFWMSQEKEPPPGACEQIEMVRLYVARHNSASVAASVVGEAQVDPLYTMNLVAHDRSDGISIVVVAPPPEAAEIRLVNTAGEVLDRVAPFDRLVALAGLDEVVDVEALSDDGVVVAACPHDGITINEITYPCTIAPGEQLPVTTTMIIDSATP
ncbi:MAG: hypothetical protein U9R47_09590 [Actinomycetota bacterium]|nr:hypothetical protein [Actinomycetota bacterium]